MNNYKKNYTYKGYTITYSEQYEIWEIEPRNKTIQETERIYNNLELPTFSTLAFAKSYLKENKDQIDNLIENFLNPQ